MENNHDIPSSPDGFVLMPILYPWLVHDQLALSLSAYIQQYSHAHIVFILCDHHLEEEQCELTNSNKHDNATTCSNCVKNKTNYLKYAIQELSITRYTILKISDLNSLPRFTTNNDRPNIELVLSTLYRRHRVSSINELVSSPHLRSQEILKEYNFGLRVYDGLVKLVEYLRRLTSASICGFVFNGRFTPYRAFYLAFKSSGVSAMYHERGNKNGTFKISLNIPCDYFEDISYAIRNHRFSNPHELKLIDDYFETRRKGRDTGFLSFVSDTHSENLFRKARAKTVSLFTSSLDEKAPANRLICSEHFSMLAHKLAEYCKNTSSELVVRHHPNLGVVGNPLNSSRVVSTINSRISSQPNIRIFQPDNPIDTWSIVEKSDVVIAPYSTLHIDALAAGKMCVTSQLSALRHVYPKTPTFTSDFRNLDLSINNAISNSVNSSFKSAQIQSAKSFAYFFYLSCSLKFYSCEIEDSFKPAANFPHSIESADLKHDWKWIFETLRGTSNTTVGILSREGTDFKIIVKPK